MVLSPLPSCLPATRWTAPTPSTLPDSRSPTPPSLPQQSRPPAQLRASTPCSSSRGTCRPSLRGRKYSQLSHTHNATDVWRRDDSPDGSLDTNDLEGMLAAGAKECCSKDSCGTTKRERPWWQALLPEGPDCRSGSRNQSRSQSRSSARSSSKLEEQSVDLTWAKCIKSSQIKWLRHARTLHAGNKGSWCQVEEQNCFNHRRVPRPSQDLRLFPRDDSWATSLRLPENQDVPINWHEWRYKRVKREKALMRLRERELKMLQEHHQAQIRQEAKRRSEQLQPKPSLPNPMESVTSAPLLVQQGGLSTVSLEREMIDLEGADADGDGLSMASSTRSSPTSAMDTENACRPSPASFSPQPMKRESSRCSKLSSRHASLAFVHFSEASDSPSSTVFREEPGDQMFVANPNIIESAAIPLSVWREKFSLTDLNKIVVIFEGLRRNNSGYAIASAGDLIRATAAVLKHKSKDLEGLIDWACLLRGPNSRSNTPWEAKSNCGRDASEEISRAASDADTFALESLTQFLRCVEMSIEQLEVDAPELFWSPQELEKLTKSFSKHLRRKERILTTKFFEMVGDADLLGMGVETLEDQQRVVTAFRCIGHSLPKDENLQVGLISLKHVLNVLAMVLRCRTREKLTRDVSVEIELQKETGLGLAELALIRELYIGFEQISPLASSGGLLPTWQRFALLLQNCGVRSLSQIDLDSLKDITSQKYAGRLSDAVERPSGVLQEVSFGTFMLWMKSVFQFKLGGISLDEISPGDVAVMSPFVAAQLQEEPEMLATPSSARTWTSSLHLHQ